jgi:hypothetical protein
VLVFFVECKTRGRAVALPHHLPSEVATVDLKDCKGQKAKSREQRAESRRQSRESIAFGTGWE